MGLPFALPRLSLGAMTFGQEAWGTGEREAAALLDAYLERGPGLVDTADVYADKRSEDILGRALRGRREGVLLATKAGFPTGEHAGARGLGRAHLAQALEASLRRLATDRVDLFQVHVWDSRPPLEETLGALDALVRAGKARAVGVSNWTGWQLVEAAALARASGLAAISTLQTQYSLAVRDVEHDALVVAPRHGVHVLAWGSLASGLLSGKYRPDSPAPEGARLGVDRKGPRTFRSRVWTPRSFEIVAALTREAHALGTTPARLALAWVLARPGLASVIVGPRTQAQLEDAFAAAAVVVPVDVVARLEAGSRPPVPFPHDEAAAIDGILYGV
jgi:aryl-alcohol dehydrogenase-like predicted oxidoreductase